MMSLNPLDWWNRFWAFIGREAKEEMIELEPIRFKIRLDSVELEGTIDFPEEQKKRMRRRAAK